MSAVRIAIYDEPSGKWMMAEGVTNDCGASIKWWADGEPAPRPGLDNSHGEMQLITVEIMAARVWLVDDDVVRERMGMEAKEVEK